LTDIAPVSSAGTTPTPSAAYLSPNLDAASDDRSEYVDACAHSLLTDRGAMSRRSHGSADTVSSMTMPMPMPASVGDVGTLPKLVVNEPTLMVSIVEVWVPWMFWVQRHSRTSELDDIMDRLE